jgi:hypothetical protein
MENEKEPGKKILVETIDCTPTWAGILPIYFQILTDPKSKQDGVDAGKRELQRMAKAADSFNELRKELERTEDEAIEAMGVLLAIIDNPKLSVSEHNAKILSEVRQLVKEHNDAKKAKDAKAGN